MARKLLYATLLVLHTTLSIGLVAGPAAAETRSLSQDWLFKAGDNQGVEKPRIRRW
jgi:hypothetical protein